MILARRRHPCLGPLHDYAAAPFRGTPHRVPPPLPCRSPERRLNLGNDARSKFLGIINRLPCAIADYVDGRYHCLKVFAPRTRKPSARGTAPRSDAHSAPENAPRAMAFRINWEIASASKGPGTGSKKRAIAVRPQPSAVD